MSNLFRKRANRGMPDIHSFLRNDRLNLQYYGTLTRMLLLSMMGSNCCIGSEKRRNKSNDLINLSSNISISNTLKLLTKVEQILFNTNTKFFTKLQL